MTALDPYDAGALLLAAVTAHRAATGLSQAEVARAAGLLPPALSQALRNPDARPALVRRVLAVTGHRVALTVHPGATPPVSRPRR